MAEATKPSEAVDLILTEFRDNSPFAADKIAWPNVNYKPDNSDFCRITVQHFDGDQITLAGVGNRDFRYFGLITVQVFTETQSGVNSALEYAEQIKDIFEGKHIENIWLRKSRVNDIGIDSDNPQYYQVNVLVDFQYNVVK